jgi:hypothetical protein
MASPSGSPVTAPGMDVGKRLPGYGHMGVEASQCLERRRKFAVRAIVRRSVLWARCRPNGVARAVAAGPAREGIDCRRFADLAGHCAHVGRACAGCARARHSGNCRAVDLDDLLLGPSGRSSLVRAQPAPTPEISEISAPFRSAGPDGGRPRQNSGLGGHHVDMRPACGRRARQSGKAGDLVARVIFSSRRGQSLTAQRKTALWATRRRSRAGGCG